MEKVKLALMTNRELIEEENFRVLFDAIFENEKAEENVESEEGTEARPLKRLRQDGQGSSAAALCEILEICGPSPQTVVDTSPLTDNVHLAAVVTMHHLIEQFINSEKEALKVVAAAEDRANKAEEKARACMTALLQLEEDRINSNLALKKMEKDKSAVEEKLKKVREIVLDQAHKLDT